MAARTATATVQATHDPNGGPWELALRPADRADALPAFTSEPAGPLEPVIAATTHGVVVAWPSTTYGGIALVESDLTGATAPVRALPSGVSPYEAGVAIAGGKDVRLAYVACGAGGTVVRTASASDARPAVTVTRAITEAEVLPQSSGHRGFLRRYDAAPGGLIVGFEDVSGADHSRIYGLDADGTLGRAQGELSAFGPRCDWHTAAPGGIFAWSCCDDRSICRRSDVRVATLTGEVLAETVITPSDPLHAQPALAVSGDRIALAMVRGEYSSRRVVVYLASRSGAPGRAFAAGRPIELPAWDGDRVAAPAAAFAGDALLVVYQDSHRPQRPRDRTELHVVRVGPDGDVSDIDEQIDEPGWGNFGPRRMASVPGGAALLHADIALGEPRASLAVFSPDGALVARRVVARGASVQAPFLAANGDELAAVWFDPRNDGDWVAFLSKDGTPTRAPLRVDRPELRASRDAPAIVPLGPGRWRVFWSEPPSLLSALVEGRSR